MDSEYEVITSDTESESDLLSQCSDSELDSYTDRDAHVHNKGEFYGCYLLVSKNPRFKGRTYIGFTVDPNRRIKQHNGGCQMGGARRTSGRGPWDMVLIVHGFPSDVAALKFEWAWQHPAHSRRLGKAIAKRKSKETPFQYRFRIVSEMLVVGPWSRLPLTVRWLKQEYEIPFSLNKQPPLHMPIAYGLVNICKATSVSNEKTRPHSQALTQSQDENAVNNDVEVQAAFSIGGESVELQSCSLCSSEEKIDSPVFVRCYREGCSLVAHVTCLAPRLCHDSDHLIPVSGSCPECGQEVMWGELIKRCKRNIEKKRPLESDDVEMESSSQHHPPPPKRQRARYKKDHTTLVH